MIVKEGIDKLSVAELQNANQERGIVLHRAVIREYGRNFTTFFSAVLKDGWLHPFKIYLMKFQIIIYRGQKIEY